MITMNKMNWIIAGYPLEREKFSNASCHSVSCRRLILTSYKFFRMNCEKHSIVGDFKPYAEAYRSLVAIQYNHLIG